MVLGIQKLTGASGPVEVAKPNFVSTGINKAKNIVAYHTLPSWPDDGGSLDEGPVQNDSAIGDLGAIKQWLRGTPMPWRISFWIKVPAGGGGNIFTLKNPGYLFLGPNNTDQFAVNVTETGISLTDNQGYNLSRTLDLNKENTGWHHIWIEYDRDQSGGDRKLYVDGRNRGWDTSTYVGPGGRPTGDGYGEFSIGGARTSTQVGVEQVISYNSVSNSFCLAHLGIWATGVSLSQVYPFYDPGDTGKLSGTYQQNDNPTPYPSIWCELDLDDQLAEPIKGYSLQGRGDTFDPTADPTTIFDAAGLLSYVDITANAGTPTIYPCATSTPPGGLKLFQLEGTTDSVLVTYNWRSSASGFWEWDPDDTVSFWIKHKKTETFVISSSWQDSTTLANQNMAFLYQDEGTPSHKFELRFATSGGTGLPNANYSMYWEPTLTQPGGDSNWNHYLIKRDGDSRTFILYINGQSAGSQTIPSNYSSVPKRIGNTIRFNNPNSRSSGFCVQQMLVINNPTISDLLDGYFYKDLGTTGPAGAEHFKMFYYPFTGLNLQGTADQHNCGS